MATAHMYGLIFEHKLTALSNSTLAEMCILFHPDRGYENGLFGILSPLASLVPLPSLSPSSSKVSTQVDIESMFMRMIIISSKKHACEID